MPIVDSLKGFFKGLEQDMGRGIQNIRSTLRNNENSPSGDNPTEKSNNCDYDDDDSGNEKDSSPPRSTIGRRQSVAAEAFDPSKDTSDDDLETRHVTPKTDDQRARLNQAVNRILLFKCLDESQMIQVIDAMAEMRVKTNERVITQGEDGDNFYVIEKGTYDVYTKVMPRGQGELKPLAENGANTSTEQNNQLYGDKIGSYTDKGSFGELALMYNTPRAATIVAATEGILWVMDRVTFRRIVLKAAFLKRQLYENLLESVPLFRELNSYERTSVADALVNKVFQDGQKIISQGEGGNEMFFIESGIVRITIKQEDREIEISRLQKGGYFGELALITKQPRAASVYALGKTTVAVLDVASFERLMGPCLDVMQRNINTYDKQLEELLGPGFKTSRMNLRGVKK